MQLRDCTKRIAGAAGLPLIAATLLPIIPSDEWWIRAFEFPRAQIALLLVVVIATAVAAAMRRSGSNCVLIGALTLCLAYQLARVLPYTPLWSVEMPSAHSCPSADRLRFMEANVLQSNRNARGLLALVRKQQPDVLLLTETDRWWADQLNSLRSEMPYAVTVPQNNTYGMMLLSRLPLAETNVRYLMEPDVPSIRANLRLESGRQIEVYGVHPRPPGPGQDTAERDAELVLVGREVRKRAVPAIVAGDLNDVAWSNTTALFQTVSGLRDPRIGRKLMPTFPAALPWLRWPLDYLFASPGFELLNMQRLGNFGSDHLPISLDLCASKLARAKLPPPRLDREVRDEVRITVEKGREEVADN